MDGRLDLERQLGVLRAVNADLVVLQEVDVGTTRSGEVDQCTYFAEGLEMQALFARAVSLQGGEYGVALLSRWPVLEKVVLPLPAEAGHEDRVFGALRVAAPGSGELWLGGTHLARHSKALRAAQAEVVEAFFRNAGCVVLAGDFNAGPDACELAGLRARWQRAPLGATWPADVPEKAIDHIYFQPAGRLALCESSVVEEGMASDHRPVRAVFGMMSKDIASPGW